MRSSNEPNEEGTGEFPHAAFAAALNTADRADKARRRWARIAEPILSNMPSAGCYDHSPKEFEALARYLLDYRPAETRDALTEGRFKFGTLEFVRDESLSTGPTVSVSEFSRLSGTPKQTVSYRIGQFRPRSIGCGKRKRYYLSDLQALFAA